MDNMYFKDTRAISGYGAVLCVQPYDSTDGLYEMLIPLEGITSVFSDKETFEVNLLNVESKSLIEGKYNVTVSENDFLWHRDNIYRLEQFVGKVLKFLVVFGDWTGYTFTGKISYRPNDSEADKQTGTISITPYYVNSTPILQANDLVKPTCTFTTEIPSTITFDSETTTRTVAIEALPSDASFTITSSNSAFSATVSGGTLTVTCTASAAAYGIIYITASADDYASWTTTIAVEYEA